MVFYNGNLPLGFILHEHDGHLIRVQRRLVLGSLKSPEATSTIVLSVAENTDCVCSRDDSFKHVPSGIVLNALSGMTVCQHRHKVHKTPLPGPTKEIGF